MDMNISATDFIKAATDTARYFGFKDMAVLKKDPACTSCKKKAATRNDSAADRKLDALHGMLTQGACSYYNEKLNSIEGPVLLYSMESVPRSGETAFSFQILNVEKSIAETMLIQTMRTLLEEVGFPHHSVRINSIGDADSTARYVRELTAFLRKRIDLLPPDARELMKEHPFLAFRRLIEKEHELAHKTPNSLEYLSDPSRKHFREIVEFLDMAEALYEIDPKLIGHPNCYSDTLFAIDITNDNYERLEEQPIYIRGGRYNSFVSRMAHNAVPAAGVVAVLRNKRAPARTPKAPKTKDPSVFVVQIGFGPKVRSLLLMNQLKRAGIPSTQDIISDSLGGQLSAAKNCGAKFAVIVGQKEFVEGTVMLRNLSNETQEIVPADKLLGRLKRIA